MRCLPNPHYDPLLRPLTGKDAKVVEFLEADANVAKNAPPTCPDSWTNGCLVTFETTAAILRWPSAAPGDVIARCTSPKRWHSVFVLPFPCWCAIGNWEYEPALLVCRKGCMRTCCAGHASALERATARSDQQPLTSATSVSDHHARIHRRLGYALRDTPARVLAAGRVRVFLLYSPVAQIVARQEMDLALPGRAKEAEQFFAKRFASQPGNCRRSDVKNGSHR